MPYNLSIKPLLQTAIYECWQRIYMRCVHNTQVAPIFYLLHFTLYRVSFSVMNAQLSKLIIMTKKIRNPFPNRLLIYAYLVL